MIYTSSILLSFFIATAFASPALVNLEERAVNCQKLIGALAILKPLGPPASTYCSEFLKIPATSTILTTITPPAVTVFTSTTTITDPLSTCEPTVLAAAGAAAGRVAAPPPEGHIQIAARDVHSLERRINIPALEIFASSQISSACSCLSVKPKQTTTVSVSIAAETVSAIATATACTPPPPPPCLPVGSPLTSCGMEIERCCVYGNARGCWFAGFGPLANLGSDYCDGPFE